MSGQQMKIWDPKTLSAHLAARGVSPRGVQSVRDNGITGEMLLDFCEEDIHDAFSVFKDRFIVRKTIREFKSFTKPTGMHNSQILQANALSLGQANNTARPVVSKTFTASSPQPKSPAHTYQAPANVSHPRTYSTFQAPYSQHNLQHNQPKKETFQLTRPSEVKLENVSKPGCSSASSGSSFSSHSDVHSFPKPVRSPLMHHVVSSSVEERVPRPDTVIIPTGEPITNISQNQVVRSLNIITAEEKQRIKRYSAEALLERKSIRSKPNEAQHLGSLAIRNAAQVAQIWDNPPVLREIPNEKRETFVNSLLAFAPQLADTIDMVWVRLREALQNRRKYLSDKETGKRQTKAYRSNPYEKRKSNSPILLKVTEAGSLIDLTETK
ncbi:uncharacterized protein LOC133188730 [Saccostrea echinata]|uniref:uncharacterized protein LOC133188730 n=1 Tax=Saccostrea echinata TaxID=191078 RepID=UPI002A8405CC|nr:uncharacterized protein LOC133188730 [Saccostrea echinata]